MKQCKKCKLITAYFFGDICPYCKQTFKKVYIKTLHFLSLLFFKKYI